MTAITKMEEIWPVCGSPHLLYSLVLTPIPAGSSCNLQDTIVQTSVDVAGPSRQIAAPIMRVSHIPPQITMPTAPIVSVPRINPTPITAPIAPSMRVLQNIHSPVAVPSTAFGQVSRTIPSPITTPTAPSMRVAQAIPPSTAAILANRVSRIIPPSITVPADPIPRAAHTTPPIVVPTGPSPHATLSVAVPTGPILNPPSVVLAAGPSLAVPLANSATSPGTSSLTDLSPAPTITGPSLPPLLRYPPPAILASVVPAPSLAPQLADTSLGAQSRATIPLTNGPPCLSPLDNPLSAVQPPIDLSAGPVTAPAADTIGCADPTPVTPSNITPVIPTVPSNVSDHIAAARPRRVHLIVSAPQHSGTIQDTVAIGQRGADAPDTIGGPNATAATSVIQTTSRRSGRLAGKR